MSQDSITTVLAIKIGVEFVRAQQDGLGLKLDGSVVVLKRCEGDWPMAGLLEGNVTLLMW